MMECTISPMDQKLDAVAAVAPKLNAKVDKLNEAITAFEMFIKHVGAGIEVDQVPAGAVQPGNFKLFLGVARDGGAWIITLRLQVSESGDRGDPRPLKDCKRHIKIEACQHFEALVDAMIRALTTANAAADKAISAVDAALNSFHRHGIGQKP